MKSSDRKKGKFFKKSVYKSKTGFNITVNMGEKNLQILDQFKSKLEKK